jgi:poly-gamma-glutamate synthesis protein (capsule biosynthesis protein)
MGGSALPKLKKYGPDSFFVNVKTLLSQADLCVGNLEGPLGNEGQIYVDKKYTFLTPPEAAQGLLNAGFKILTLANNHAMDFGPDAMNSTLAALDALGLKHAGEGQDETAARQSAVVEVADRRIAVLAYSLTYPSEFWAGVSKPGTAQGDGYDIRQDVAAARQAGADLVFVCIHWGQEGKTTLRGYQPSLAKVALDAGADAVIGHHPHIWQALGVLHGKPVAYSLGNFVFGSYSAKVTRSGILYLTFDEDNHWTGGRVIPLNVHNGDVQFAPRPIAGVEGRKFADHLSTLSKPQGAKLRWDGKAVQWIVPQIN